MTLNPILQSLSDRRSVRAFTAAPVEPADKEAILEAAFQAPTAGCQQLYTILDITNQGLKDRLAVTCDNQPFIASAPLVLVFCADCRRWWRAYRDAGCAPRDPGAGDLLLAVEDALIAAQNAVVAAESLGLGSCYIGDILENCEEHRALLTLPRYVVPVALLVLGHPTEQQRSREKPRRFDRRFVVLENGYRDMDGAELRAMFAGHTGGQDFEGFLTAFCNRKYNADFSREMSRSAAEYLTDFMGGS